MGDFACLAEPQPTSTHSKYDARPILWVEIAKQKAVLEQDAVLDGLMPALNLALRGRVNRARRRAYTLGRYDTLTNKRLG
jgi:hypothetical protein